MKIEEAQVPADVAEAETVLPADAPNVAEAETIPPAPVEQVAAVLTSPAPAPSGDRSRWPRSRRRCLRRCSRLRLRPPRPGRAQAAGRSTAARIEPKPARAEAASAVAHEAPPPASPVATSSGASAESTGTGRRNRRRAVVAAAGRHSGRARRALPPATDAQRAIRRARSICSQQGTVIVRALVGPDGSADDIVVWRSSGYALLDAAALRAVRGWAFEPASVSGRRITAWVEVPVRFAIR